MKRRMLLKAKLSSSSLNQTDIKKVIGMSYISKNPYTGETNKEFETITNDLLHDKISLAKNGQITWKNECFEFRGKLLAKLAQILHADAEKYAKLITIEMGKPISQSIGEVKKCAWLCQYYADNGPKFILHQKKESTAEMSQINFDPLGVIFGIMPWNFPFWQVFRFAIPAIMAGNSILLKHASNVPLCAEAIPQLFTEAGFHENIFQNLFISHQQVETAISSPMIQGVSFTGSNEVGSLIGSLAGKYFKKSVMELGGSDPFIVLNDADLNHALELAVLSRFLNSGQSCIAAKRFILHEEISEEFINNFISLIENFAIGDPLKEKTFLGPMVNEDAILLLEEQIEKSIKMGAQCLIGGKRNPNNHGSFLPTLISNVPHDSPLWTEEIFGPVAVVCDFSSSEEAIELANDTIFGLGASVWTDDLDLANYFAEKIETGTVAINNMVKSEPGLPFGGVKQSGYGRELSDIGMYEFMNIKTVTIS